MDIGRIVISIIVILLLITPTLIINTLLSLMSLLTKSILVMTLIPILQILDHLLKLIYLGCQLYHKLFVALVAGRHRCQVITVDVNETTVWLSSRR